MLYLSTPQNIEALKAGNDLISLTLSGGLLLLAFYFLINPAMRRRAVYLCLVLCCVLMALRDQNFYIVHLLQGPPLFCVLKRRGSAQIVVGLPAVADDQRRRDQKGQALRRRYRQPDAVQTQ